MTTNPFDMSQATEMLQKIRSIQDKYDTLQKAKAERFNFFRMLELERKEDIHSRFLGELLDPEGSHQQGATFLNLFCDRMKMDEFNSEAAKVYLEKRTPQGYIDIFVDGGGQSIIIENKIDAGDQDKQLERYAEYGQQQGKSFQLFYLNLHGHAPGEESRGELEEGKGFQIISYRDDIKAWLEDCLKEVVMLPLVRENIHQYLSLIKKLTGQFTNHQHMQEVIDTLKSNEYYKLVPKLQEAYKQLRSSTELFFWKSLKDKIEQNETLGPRFKGYLRGPKDETLEEKVKAEKGKYWYGYHIDLGDLGQLNYKLKIQRQECISLQLCVYKQGEPEKGIIKDENRINEPPVDPLYDKLLKALGADKVNSPAFPLNVQLAGNPWNFNRFDSAEIDNLIKGNTNDISSLVEETEKVWKEITKIMEDIRSSGTNS